MTGYAGSLGSALQQCQSANSEHGQHRQWTAMRRCAEVRQYRNDDGLLSCNDVGILKHHKYYRVMLAGLRVQ